MKFSFAKLFVILACILVVIAALSSGKVTRADKSVVIPFSHKSHVDNYGIKDCAECHKYDAYGVFKGLPSVGECTACHRGNGDLFSNDRKTNPRKKTMFDSYADKDRPWKSGVEDVKLFYYSHKISMATKMTDDTTRIRCDLCHGDKSGSTGKANVKGEKLMEQCIYCHTAFKLNNQCDVCHR